jgi:hypothetical protein
LLQVFEDENEAVRYCDLLQGGGKGCEGVAEIEASSVRVSSKLLTHQLSLQLIECRSVMIFPTFPAGV